MATNKNSEPAQAGEARKASVRPLANRLGL